MRSAYSLFLLGMFFLAAADVPVQAKWMGKQTGCYPDSLNANPNRPTVANPADITQYGVLELEYGFDRFWNGGGQRQASLGGLLKFAVWCDVEVRWNTTSYVRQTDSAGTQSGVGDNWLGPQVRIRKQTAFIPSLAFSYSFKFPAESSNGLRTDRVDHALTFLASKDIKRVHFDFNATHFWIGHATQPGYDGNYQINLG